MNRRLPDMAPEGDEGCEYPPQATSLYHCMMNYINTEFLDVLGWRVEQEDPVTPGTSISPAHGGQILLSRVQPSHFFMEQANNDYLRGNEKRFTSVGYSLGRLATIYNVAGQVVYRYAALVNHNLHNTLTPIAREPCSLYELLELARMEEVVARS